LHLKFRHKLSKFGSFFRFFKNSYTPHLYSKYQQNYFYEGSFDGFDEPISSEHIIFHPISMGAVPNNEVSTDINLLVSRNKDVLRYHYFSMKAYFIRFCNDPFLKAYYVNLQKEKNDNYYGFMKFYFSKDEVLRRHEDRLCRIDEIPF